MISAICIVATMSVIVPVSASEITVEKATITGDINNDGRVNVIDVLEMRRRLLHIVDTTEDDVKFGDVNSNGKLDIADLLAVKKYVLGEGTLNSSGDSSITVKLNSGLIGTVKSLDEESYEIDYGYTTDSPRLTSTFAIGKSAGIVGKGEYYNSQFSGIINTDEHPFQVGINNINSSTALSGVMLEDDGLYIMDLDHGIGAESYDGDEINTLKYTASLYSDTFNEKSISLYADEYRLDDYMDVVEKVEEGIVGTGEVANSFGGVIASNVDYTDLLNYDNYDSVFFTAAGNTCYTTELDESNRELNLLIGTESLTMDYDTDGNASSFNVMNKEFKFGYIPTIGEIDYPLSIDDPDIMDGQLATYEVTDNGDIVVTDRYDKTYTLSSTLHQIDDCYIALSKGYIIIMTDSVVYGNNYGSVAAIQLSDDYTSIKNVSYYNYSYSEIHGVSMSDDIENGCDIQILDVNEAFTSSSRSVINIIEDAMVGEFDGSGASYSLLKCNSLTIDDSETFETYDDDSHKELVSRRVGFNSTIESARGENPDYNAIKATGTYNTFGSSVSVDLVINNEENGYNTSYSVSKTGYTDDFNLDCTLKRNLIDDESETYTLTGTFDSTGFTEGGVAYDGLFDAENYEFTNGTPYTNTVITYNGVTDSVDLEDLLEFTK
jgi:hypothetical protein